MEHQMANYAEGCTALYLGPELQGVSAFSELNSVDILVGAQV